VSTKPGAGQNAYFQGVNIGWTGLRFFITINATFGAAFSVLAGLKDQPVVAGHIVKVNSNISLGIAGAAIVLCAAVFFVQKHYFAHLENCRSRCQQLEAEWDGQLFTELGRIEKDRFLSTYALNSQYTLNLIILCIAILWGLAALL
jgi:hypothetical protein